MNKSCKDVTGGVKSSPTVKSTKGTFVSLLLAACTAFTACNSEDTVIENDNRKQLQLSFGINAQESRALYTDATLPDASPVGVMLDGYDDYLDLVYTGTTTSGKQTWTADKDVRLSDTQGTLYAYWPYASTVNINAIDVDMTAADQTDWLYATPVTGICENKAEAAVIMNHAAANINVTVNKGTYLGEGNISNITIQSDAFALGGTFNAAQATPGYTAFEDEGEPLSRDLTTTTGAATDIMVVPNGNEAAITFLATIDGIQFTATSAAVTLEKGNSYQYTLNLSDISTYMTVGSFAVTPWGTVAKDNLDLEVYDEFDEGIVATYYIDEAQFASRAAEGVEVEMQLVGYDYTNAIREVERMQVDGVEVTPSAFYTFTSGGEHTVKFLLKDNTKIPGSMFAKNKNLTGLILPKTIERIGVQAFWGCSSISSELVIPESVTHIEEQAFNGCANMTGDLRIPNSCVLIGEGAFNNCQNITGDLIIPNGVKSLGQVTGYYSDYGCFRNCKKLESVILPEGLLSIGDYAFAGCSGLTGELIIPESVTRIGCYAFNGCAGLTGELVIPNSVVELKEKSGYASAFEGCKGFTSLKLSENLTNIPLGSFAGCTGLSGKLTIPSSVLTIQDGGGRSGAFQNCTGLTSIVLGTGLQKIGSKSFQGCSGLTGELVIPESVTTIGSGAFQNCRGLSGSLTIPAAVTVIDNNSFENCVGLLEIKFETGIKIIGGYAFKECTGVTSVTIGESVETIGEGAFRNCKGLTEISIPESVQTIGQSAFRECSGLTEVTIGSGVTSIGDAAFLNCTKLSAIYFLGQVCPDFGLSSFYDLKDCVMMYHDTAQGFEKWSYSCKRRTFESVNENGIWYSADGKTLYMADIGYKENVIIKEGVINVADYAFYKNNEMTGTLSLPESVTYIGDYSFYQCKKMTGSLVIPENVTYIGKCSFQECRVLPQNFIIPDKVKEIGYRAFYGCPPGKSIVFGSGLEFIGNEAFYAWGCNNWINSIICKSTTAPSISSNTFYGIYSNGVLTVPQGCTDAYASWMSTDNYYLGKYNWTIQELTE